jgi:ribosomal protein L10
VTPSLCICVPFFISISRIPPLVLGLRQNNPKLKNLEDLVRGNMGFVFTNDDPKAVRDAIATCKVPAAARAGTFAPVDVFVPPGPTGMDPSQTAFFQALNIGTKIVKGAIEIINQVHLLKPGDKVGNSEVALLAKLNIKPFTFGLQLLAVRPFPWHYLCCWSPVALLVMGRHPLLASLACCFVCVLLVNPSTYPSSHLQFFRMLCWVPRFLQVYEDGSQYSPTVLDLTTEALVGKFLNASNRVAAISLATGYPTLASLPHMVSNGYLKLLSLSLATEYTFERAQKMKDFLKNPGAFASAAPSAAAPAAAAKVEVKKEEEEEDALDGGFSLFD